MRRLPSLGVLSERRFRLLFFSRTVSAFGNQMAPIALAFAVLDLTHSATDLGLVIAAEEGAQVVVLLAGGVWADRLRRDRIMLATDLVQGAAQATTAALVLEGSARVWQLLILQAISGAATGFFRPAANGLLPQVVAPADLLQANSLLSLTTSTVGILGPAVGGALVVAGSPGIALAADAATFFVSAVFVAQLDVARVARTAHARFHEDLRSGWGEFTRHRWL